MNDELLWKYYYSNNVLQKDHRSTLLEAARIVYSLIAITSDPEELEHLGDYIVSLSEIYDLKTELVQQFGAETDRIFDLYVIVAYTARFYTEDFRSEEISFIRRVIPRLARDFEWANLPAFVQMQPYAVRELREHDVVCSTLKSLYPNDVDESLI